MLGLLFSYNICNCCTPGELVMAQPAQPDVLDVLLFVFEHFTEEVDTDSFVEPNKMAADSEWLNDQLSDAGFPDNAIDHAVRWLNDLVALQSEITADITQPEQPIEHRLQTSKSSFRILAPQESARLTPASQSLLLYMEQSGILHATQRELLLERLLALEVSALDEERLKWLTLIVLSNQPAQAEAFSRIEALIYEDEDSTLH